MQNTKAVCESREQLAYFLEKLNVDTLGIICPKLSLDRGVSEFDPDLEDTDLLKSWLRYRNYDTFTASDESQPVLATYAKENMRERGNFPPFAEFLDFDPQTASIDFLSRWMSWYGVTSFKPRTREWWVYRVKKLQKMLSAVFRKPTTSKSILDDLQKLHKLQRVISKSNHYLFQLNLCFGRFSSEDLDSVVDVAKPVLKTNWGLKKILAVALDASAIAVPFIISEKKQAIREMLPGKTELRGGFRERLQQSIGEKVKEQATQRLLKEGGLLLFGKSDDKNPLVSLGADLSRDVIELIYKKDSPVPKNVLRNLAVKYLSHHPNILKTITEVIVPAVDLAWTKK